MAQSAASIYAYCQRKLGGGVIGVELTTEQLEDSLESAMMWYQSVIGQLKFVVLDIPTGGGAVPAADIAIDCMSVVEVAFNLKNADMWDQFDWAGVELGPLSFGMYGGYSADGYGIGGGYSYLVQAMQYREQAKNILSTARDWRWDYAQRALVLFPTGGTELGDKAAVWYASTEVDLERLQTYEYLMIKKYTLAGAMETLGYIRSKYADIPSATGSLTLNGDTLLANAEALKDEIHEKAKNLRAPPGFFAG